MASSSEIESDITVSIVSHGQAGLVSTLLRDLANVPQVARVLVTVNFPEGSFEVPWNLDGRIDFIRNQARQGFAQNHNVAFARCRTTFFCVLNPDMRLPENPFPALLRHLVDPKVAFAAPLIKNPAGGVEDSARYYPTPVGLLLRLARLHDGRYPLGDDAEACRPEWVAGMFMLFRSETYRAAGGFDEGFFLYCEDIDLCARLRQAGYDFILSRRTFAVHDARRHSRRDLRYGLLHLRSIARFFLKHFGRLPRRLT